MGNFPAKMQQQEANWIVVHLSHVVVGSGWEGGHWNKQWSGMNQNGFERVMCYKEIQGGF